MFAEYLDGFREIAEGRMDECSTATIRRKTGKTTQNETTGRIVPVWSVVHADMPFRLGGSDSGDSASRREDVGGVEIQTAVRIGHLPVTADGLQDGDWIDVLSGENSGTAWRIVEAAFKDQATARRVPLLAETRPEEWP